MQPVVTAARKGILPATELTVRALPTLLSAPFAMSLCVSASLTCPLLGLLTCRVPAIPQAFITEVADLAPSYAISALLLDLMGGSSEDLQAASACGTSRGSGSTGRVTGTGVASVSVPLAPETQLVAFHALLRLLHCVPVESTPGAAALACSMPAAGQLPAGLTRGAPSGSAHGTHGGSAVWHSFGAEVLRGSAAGPLGGATGALRMVQVVWPGHRASDALGWRCIACLSTWPCCSLQPPMRRQSLYVHPTQMLAPTLMTTLLQMSHSEVLAMLRHGTHPLDVQGAGHLKPCLAALLARLLRIWHAAHGQVWSTALHPPHTVAGGQRGRRRRGRLCAWHRCAGLGTGYACYGRWAHVP